MKQWQLTCDAGKSRRVLVGTQVGVAAEVCQVLLFY